MKIKSIVKNWNENTHIIGEKNFASLKKNNTERTTKKKIRNEIISTFRLVLIISSSQNMKFNW